MRQGYEFLDEKRMLLAVEMLRQLRDYQERLGRLVAETKNAARRSPPLSSGTVSISFRFIRRRQRQRRRTTSEPCSSA